MATSLDAVVGITWLVNIILDIGAAYYAYKLTKITGGFRAWWLIIAFTILFAVNSFTSVSYGILSSAMGTTGTISAALSGTALFDVALSLLLSVLLFAAMFELYGTFARMRRPVGTKETSAS